MNDQVTGALLACLACSDAFACPAALELKAIDFLCDSSDTEQLVRQVRAYLARCGAEWAPPPGGVVRLAPNAPPRALPHNFVGERVST